MTDNHNYAIRRFQRPRHVQYTATCPQCGKRHTLIKWYSIYHGKYMYSLDHGSASYHSWSASELDAMAADNG